MSIWDRLRYVRRKLLLSESLEFVIERLPEHRKRKTSTGGRYQRSVRILTDMFGDLPVTDYTPEMFNTWYQSRIDAGVKLSTAKAEYYAIKGYFTHLRKMGRIKENPCNVDLITDDSPIEPQPAVTKENFDLMVSKCSNLRDIAILKIAWDSGARPNEIRLMRLSTTKIKRYIIMDGKPVILEDNAVIPDGTEAFFAGFSKITIPKRKPGYIKFKDDACRALLRWMEARPPPIKGHSDWVWLTKRKSLPSVDAFYRVFKSAGERAGVKISNPRAFRTGFGVRMRKNGVPLQMVSTALNHSNLAVTHDFYQRLWPDDQLDEFLRMSMYLNDNDSELKT